MTQGDQSNKKVIVDPVKKLSVAFSPTSPVASDKASPDPMWTPTKTSDSYRYSNSLDSASGSRDY